ncbi:uncharacterized protein LOC114735745 [Neltuma alba]|uniref:uncharacterized protein LOC114735745 n=1 Tax=Neltuma alba TaxID=207710 RepID=UPI0010A31DC3|nr:uncharacterized protein LOC114735745 [Prosopis alba]
MDDSTLVERNFAFRVSKESPQNRRSLALPFSPFTIMEGIFSRKSFSYRKLPSEPLRLSVLKLDGSCFDIVVTKMATIAELRQAVEAVFSHMPKKGPGKISWPHVWGRFCLSYDGQKLVTETDYLRNYGIKDGDQLRFIRHVSNSCNVRRRRFKKRVAISKQKRGSSSKVSSYQQKDHDGSDSDDEIGLDSIVMEKGEMQHLNNDDRAQNLENRLTSFWGGLFTCTRLAFMRGNKTKGRMCPLRLARGLLGSFRKISFYRKKRFYRKHAGIEWR